MTQREVEGEGFRGCFTRVRHAGHLINGRRTHIGNKGLAWRISEEQRCGCVV